MITIYHLDTSRSERIVWLMEELGLAYKLELYLRRAQRRGARRAQDDPPARQGADHPRRRHGARRIGRDRRIHRQSPCRRPARRCRRPTPRLRALPLLDALRRGQPDVAHDRRARADADAGRRQDARRASACSRACSRCSSFVDAELADGPYFVGAEFTAADVMMTFTFTTMRHFLDYDLAPYSAHRGLPEAHRGAPGVSQGHGAGGPKVGT